MDRLFAGFGLLWLAVWILGIVGWVWNIIALCGSHESIATAINVVRIIGIFLAPLGSFMGLFFHN